MRHSVQVDTPESVLVALEPVGIGSRLFAGIIDALIQWAVVVPIVIVLVRMAMTATKEVAANLGGNPEYGLGTGIAAAALGLLAVVIIALYKLVLESLWNGQTVGKRVAGIRVVRANGLPARFTDVLIRHLLRVADFMPGSYILGSICIMSTRHGQRLGDLAAGTLVVRDRRQPAPVVPVVAGRPLVCDPVPLREHALRLADAEMEPVRSFLARRNQFTTERRRLLAERIANTSAQRMGWPEPLPTAAEKLEWFLEEVLHARAQ